MEGQKVQNLLRPASGAGPDSPRLSFRPGKAPGLAAPRVGVSMGSRRAGAERKGLLSETRQRPTKARPGFSSQLPNRLAIFPAWELGGLGGGADPSELGMGCC